MVENLNWPEEKIPEVYPNLFKLFDSILYLKKENETLIYLKQKNGKIFPQQLKFKSKNKKTSIDEIFIFLEDLFENKKEITKILTSSKTKQ